MVDKATEHKGITVTVSKLSKVYHTMGAEVEALKEVDWQANPGETTAIMGPSGCGKTTLLNLLGGIDHPTSGKVIVEGRELDSLSERELEKYRLLKIGYIFQFFNLIPSLSAIENLEIPMVIAGVGRQERIERADSLLDMVGLCGKRDKRPEELSGGEQQRVAICLALVNDPPLILADEPTGNLDSENGMAIADLLQKLADEQKKTVIVATHDPRMVERFSHIHRMQDGRFVS
jgi:putative ABC transport system ATP-binding protein